MSDIPSTIKEPRFCAACKHCDNSFVSFTMPDLYKHLEEHEIGIHFEDVRIISNVIEKFEFQCDICEEEFHDKKEFKEHKDDHMMDCDF